MEPITPHPSTDRALIPWWGTLLLFVIVGGFYGFLATYGSWQLAGRELRGDAYDSLAVALLKGSAEVDKNAINWEGFEVEGKTFMYFGPFPALLRIPLNLLVPNMYGYWSRTSCLVAALLCVVAVWFGASHLHRSRATPHSRVGGITLVVAAALCTPIVYLVSCPRLYHEAILWGLAASLFALPAIGHLVFLNSHSRGALTWLSLMAAIALLSRITFGLPLYGAFVILALRSLLPMKGLGVHGFFATLLSGVPALLGGVAQLWYNSARFGSPFKAIDYNYFYIKPAEIGGEFNPARIYDTFSSFFGITWDLFSRFPPFFLVSSASYTRPDLFFGWRETLFPLTLSSLPIILLATLGMFALATRGYRIASLITLVLLGQGLLIGSYFFVSWRFAAEFLPLFVFLGLAYVYLHRRVPIFPALFIPIAAPMTLGATLSWHMFYATPDIDVPGEWTRSLHAALLPDLRERKESEFRTFAVSLLPSLQHLGDPRNSLRNFAHDGAPLSLFSRPFALGMGLRFDGAFRVSPPPGSKYLVGTIALPDNARSCALRDAHMVIRSEGGSILFETPSVKGNFDPIPFRIPLPAENGPLTFEFRDLDQKPDCDYVNLLDLRVLASRGDARSVDPAPLVPAPTLTPRVVDGEVFTMAQGKQVDGGELMLDGVGAQSGFGLHAPSLVRLPLPTGVHTIAARIGIPDSFRECRLTNFLLTVLGGTGQLLYGPEAFVHGSPSREILLSTLGESELVFLLSPGNVPDCDALNVVDLRVGSFVGSTSRDTTPKSR